MITKHPITSFFSSVLIVLSSGGIVSAADLQAGEIVATQCAGCHGAAGVSTVIDIPNLAAQKEAYLKLQLIAFKNGKRSNPLMNAIAASLSDADMDNLAAHFASLPGAEPHAIAENQSGLDGSLPTFPADHETTFTRYQKIDFEDRKQVRFYSANSLALQGAKAGTDFSEGAFLLVEIYSAKVDKQGLLEKDKDGHLIAVERSGFTSMEKQADWGESVPLILRNDDWRYAVFSVDGTRKEGINEGGCLACHKPLTDTDYSFTYKALQVFAQAK